MRSYISRSKKFNADNWWLDLQPADKSIANQQAIINASLFDYVHHSITGPLDGLHYCEIMWLAGRYGLTRDEKEVLRWYLKLGWSPSGGRARAGYLETG